MRRSQVSRTELCLEPSALVKFVYLHKRINVPRDSICFVERASEHGFLVARAPSTGRGCVRSTTACLLWHSHASATKATTDRKINVTSQWSERKHRSPVRLLSGQMADGCRRPSRTSKHERQTSPSRARQAGQTQACVARGSAHGTGNCRAFRGEFGAAFQPHSFG